MSEQELKDAATQWYLDIQNIDVDAIVDTYAEEGTYFDSFPMRFEGKKSYGDYTRWAMQHMTSNTAQLYQMKAEMFSDTVGMVTAHDSFTAVKNDGTALRMMGRVTFIFKKEDGKWKIHHLHASPQPAAAPPNAAT